MSYGNLGVVGAVEYSRSDRDTGLRLLSQMGFLAQGEATEVAELAT